MIMLTEEGSLAGITVCDAGCGTGFVSIPLAKQGAIISASDISAAMVAKDEMKGDTFVYLVYAHARICSIITKSGKDINDLKKHTGKLALDHAYERALGLRLLRFPELRKPALACYPTCCESISTSYLNTSPSSTPIVRLSSIYLFPKY